MIYKIYCNQINKRWEILDENNNLYDYGSYEYCKKVINKKRA